jgi:hypothetical protein
MRTQEAVMTITSDLFLAAADLQRRLGLLSPGTAPARDPRTRLSTTATLMAAATLVALLAIGVLGAGHTDRPHLGIGRAPSGSATSVPASVLRLERDPLR